jgi:iron-sulfur cluster assembly accessory protein
MSVETFDPSKLDLTVTPSALKHLKGFSERANGKSVRLWLKESGCTGYMYELDLVDEALDGDHSYQYDSLTLYVAKEATTMLNGTTIDYVTEGLNSQLKFNNPNVTAMCGCGESFSVS